MGIRRSSCTADAYGPGVIAEGWRPTVSEKTFARTRREALMAAQEQDYVKQAQEGDERFEDE